MITSGINKILIKNVKVIHSCLIIFNSDKSKANVKLNNLVLNEKGIT